MLNSQINDERFLSTWTKWIDTHGSNLECKRHTGRDIT